MPHALLLNADNYVVSYDPSKPQPISSPWLEVSKEDYLLAKSLVSPRYVNNTFISDPPPPTPPAPKRYSKLKLIRALYANNLGDLFASLLVSSAQLSMEWQAAQDLAEDDASFQQAISYLKTQANITQEAIDALLSQCEI